MKKSLSWGQFPISSFSIRLFNSDEYSSNFLKNSIPFGNGRSYGDSCINKNIINFKNYNYFISFDVNNGILKMQSGVLLIDVLEVVVPKGWFLKVNPGTKFITIGGAIASDIHGKNHHIEGCFSECINWFNLLIPSGEVVRCSKNENVELFLSTCGGMGLTGFILDVEIQLKKINSISVIQKTIKTKNLKETFDFFEALGNEPYTVAWIDCLSTGDKMGKSLVMCGDFANDGDLNFTFKKSFNIPFNFPSFFLNKLTVKLFNFLYYNKVTKKSFTKKVTFDSFFFPLDYIKNWNRIYGKKGFIQYHFVLPKVDSFIGLSCILREIADSGKVPVLSVLKLHGKENNNYLSFPLEGYSLALDFKIDKQIFIFLSKLDKIVLKYNGRIYLTKDVRVSKEVFEKGYPKIDKFRKIRTEFKSYKVLSSLQSQRIGI